MSKRSVVQRVGLLGVLAVVAGLLVAGLALPVVAGLGLAANRTNSALSKLPTYLQQPPLAQRSVLYADDGTTVLATVSGAEDRVVVTEAQIPDVMKKTIVAIEDNRFYEHNGVDLRGLLRAAKADSSSGQYDQGASTITEQYVKLVELEQAVGARAQTAATEKSISRKITDARLAIALEKTMTKDQILTNYLNIAYFGEGVYGVGTAAEHYFGVPISKVTLAQAALLAGLVNNPSGFDPVLHPVAAKTRRDEVLDAVAKYQFLPTAQVDAALKTAMVVHPQTKTVDACASSPAPNYCAFALQQLYADPKVGSTMVLTGGLRIITGWDPRIQDDTQAVLSAHVADTQRQVLEGVVEQPGTGVIAAIGQNRGYGTGVGETKNVYAAQHVNEVGSTFKLMTLTAAIDQGIPISTSIVSPSCYHLPGQDNPTGQRCKDGFSNAGDSESGSFNLATGTWDSVNTFFVQLEQKVGGPSAVAAMGTRLGIAHGLGSGQYGSSLTLGSGGGFSAIDMANAYSTIDAHGIECTPTAITQITDPTGKAVDFTHPACEQVISAQTADTVTSILQGVLTMPGATGAGLGIGRQAAGKTGTVDDGREGWFVGFIPQYVTAIGLFDPLKLGYPNSAAPICDGVTGRCFTPDTLFGASVSGVAWQDLMERIAGPLPEQDFALPEAGDPAPSPSTSPSTGPSGATPNPSTSTGPPPHPAVTVTVTPTDRVPTPSPPVAPTRRPTKHK